MIQNKKKRPVILSIYFLFVLCSTIWWFGNLAFHPETLNIGNNFIYTFTKLGALVSSIGVLLLRKWGVYLYAVTFIITCILLSVIDQPQKLPELQQNIVGAVVIIIVSIVLTYLFKKNWNKFK